MKIKVSKAYLSIECAMMQRYVRSECYEIVQERNIFAKCNMRRGKKKFRNCVYREQAGTCPSRVYGVRISAYNMVVCKGYDNRF